MKPIFISALSLIFLFAAFRSEGQAIKRESIASSGSSGVINKKVLVQQTIGQPYSTTAYYSNELELRPGFQQPPNFSLQSVVRANLSLTVYPNPATYSVTIESDETIENAIIKVTDMSGKVMVNENITNLKTHLIECGNWANGTYFITVYNAYKNHYSSKLIINK